MSHIKPFDSELRHERFLPDDMPFAIKDVINKWQNMSRSPYGDSFYSSNNKTWTYTQPDSFRVSDHWNEKTSTSVNDNYWTLAKFIEKQNYYMLSSSVGVEIDLEKVDQFDISGQLKESFYKVPSDKKEQYEKKYGISLSMGNSGVYEIILSLPKEENGYNRYYKIVEEKRKSYTLESVIGRPELRIAGAEYMPIAPEYITPETFSKIFILDTHQCTGVNLALYRLLEGSGDFMIADGTGFGKTAQILAIASVFKNKNRGDVLIISQNKQIINGRFKADAKSMGIKLSDFETGTYDDLRTKKIGNKKYGVVIYDEAHNLKNEESQKTIAAASIQADRRVFVTATPLDRPSGASYFISRLFGDNEDHIRNLLGFKRIFEKDKYGNEQFRYVLNEKMTWNRVAINIANLRDKAISEGAMVRREYPFWGQILFERKQLSDQDAEEEAGIISYWNDKIHSTDNPNVRKNYGGQKVLELSRWLESKKIEDVYSEIQSAIKYGQKIIIIAEGINKTIIKGLGGHEIDEEGVRVEGTYVEGLIGNIERRLNSEGVVFAKIYGDNDKAEEVEKFQKSEKCLIAIATPKSGGAGIDLDDQIGDAPRTLYIATPNFAGDVFEQILGRVSRKFTKSASSVVFNIYTNAFSDLKRAQIVSKKLTSLRNIQNGTDIDVASFDFQEEVDRGQSAGEKIITERKEAQRIKEQSRQEGLKDVEPDLSWKGVTSKTGKKLLVASATKDFWVWWKANKDKEGRKIWVSKDNYSGDWQVWKDVSGEQMEKGGYLYSGDNIIEEPYYDSTALVENGRNESTNKVPGKEKEIKMKNGAALEDVATTMFEYAYFKSLGQLYLFVKKNGKIFWSIRYPSFTENAVTGELAEDSTLIDIGVMKSVDDVDGLEKYLREQNVITDQDHLVVKK